MALVSCNYSRFYEGISIYGKGVATVKDAEYFGAEFFRQHPGLSSVEISNGITELEPGLLERFPTLAEIIIPDCMKKIGLTDEGGTFLRARGVIIRGTFDSYAEKFAADLKLRFMHSDIEIAQVGQYDKYGIDTITICFSPKGKPYVHQDNTCTGWAASNNGGGSIDFDLPKFFWRTMTPEQIAGKCWGTCRDEIVGSEALKKFLEGAKARKGYMT